MFYVIGIGLSFFLALLLLSKKNKTGADKILFAWLIIIGIHLSLFVMRVLAQNLSYSFLLGIEIPFPLLHGPFIYLYTAAATNQLPANKKLLWLHLIVPLLSLLMISSFFFLPAEKKIEVYKNRGAGYELQTTINIIAINISGIVYVTWCSFLLWKHRKNIEDQFSDTERISLNWLRYIVYGIGAIWLIVLFGKDELIFTAAVLFVLFLGFFGIKQEGIFTGKKNRNEPYKTSHLTITSVDKDSRTTTTYPSGKIISPLTNELVNTSDEEPALLKKKYLKSGLSTSQAEKIHASLTQLMDAEKTFTEPELTLSDLAEKLDVHANHLSQVINEKEGKNFYDYINSLRIEEFIKKASQPENKKYTLLSLAYDCGFNSKSSFNRYFKKVTGQSPSQYLNH